MNASTDRVMVYLSHNIKFLRKFYKLTKERMARISGVGIKTLNLVEQGILPPKLSVEFLFNLQNYFKISAKELISSKITEKTFSVQSNKII